jgi:uncharacterized repeat protein (TIGR03943 family)
MSTPRTTADFVRIITLLVWGAAVAWLLTTGRYIALLSPSLLWLLIATLVLLLVFLVAQFGTSGGGGRGLRPWVRALIVLCPLAYLSSATTGPGLGRAAFERRFIAAAPLDGAVAQAAAAATSAATPPAGAPASFERLPLNELPARAAEFAGRGVETEGMLLRSAELPPGSALLYRFTMRCCVSDAQPIAVVVQHVTTPDIRDDEWVRVRGTLRVQQVDGCARLCIDAVTLERIAAPANPYLAP